MLRSSPAGAGKYLSHWVYLAILAAFSFALYSEIFAYNTFGPETPLFYMANRGHSFREMLKSYSYVTLMWYRPTGFALPYWAIEQFVGWHNIFAWKFLHFWTVLGAGCAVYWMAVQCLGGSRLAGLFSALYFMAQPSLFAAVMEVAGFDFLHILLTVLCAGTYILGTRASGRRSLMLTLLSWCLFVIAVTAKEMALATPGYLLLATILLAAFERKEPLARAYLRRELLRLLPFFAVLPAYYFFHLAKIPAGTFLASGPYRATAQWGMIQANLRKFPLWITRIYAYSDETLSIHMYQSTALNNLVGICLLALVVVLWSRRARMVRSSRLVLLLMLAWLAVYLVIPTYSGGYLWHINLAVVGYSVLVGFALSWCFESIPSPLLRRTAAGFFLLGALLLGRENLNTELYAGTHASGFRLNHSVLTHPPVPAARLGTEPLIYVEDRLALGPWWYGCFGSLFKFAYLRQDLEEVIVPAMASIPQDLRQKWLARKNAFFFRYDEDFNWYDATAEFREECLPHGAIQPARACGVPGGRVRFSPQPSTPSELRRVTWSLQPSGSGTISQSGLYTAPEQPKSETVQILASDPSDLSWSARALLSFGTSAPIRIAAGRAKSLTAGGQTWDADASYEGGNTYRSTKTVEGTRAPELYQNERFAEGPLYYRFCVANGAYSVKLKFAETWFDRSGQRIFDVSINHVPVLSRFDIVKAAGGPNRAVDREFRTTVTGGEIAIEFRPVVSNPKVNAIEIVP